MSKMKFREFMKASEVKGLWSFLTWFIQTREFNKILIALVIILIYNPDWLTAIKAWIIGLLK
jgi:hypothetical protein